MPALQEREIRITQVEEQKPFAFDLAREYDLIQRHGDSYYDFFIAQSHYYAKESYGKVPNVEYEHLIERDSEGNIKLRFRDPLATFAEESYAGPVLDARFPVWYRKRAAADVRWTIAIQESLKDALPGDTFADLSPTEFDVSIEDRKKWGFGWHSFARVHRLIVEDGQEKLVSRAIRNYLDFPEQQRLSEILSGERLGLGDVGKLKEGMDIGHVNKFIQDLWGQTPLERKINPPEDQIVKSEQEMNSDLGKLDFWLNRVFVLMKNSASEELVLREFRGWENALKAAVEVESAGFNNGKNTIYPDSMMEYFMEQGYIPGANGCGAGSGFSKLGNTVTIFGKMDYLSMTKNNGDYKFDQPGPCVTCGRDILCGPCKICEGCDKRAKSGEELTEYVAGAA